MRKLRESGRVYLPWLAEREDQPPPPPPVGQAVVDVAGQIADRIQRDPSYGLSDARCANAAGWTVRLLTLGSPCRHDDMTGVRLTDDELRRAMSIARRTVVSRTKEF